MSPKLVCAGGRYSRSDPGSACWKRFGFSWWSSMKGKSIWVFQEPRPPPQLCEPVTPGLLSWLSSPLSFTSLTPLQMRDDRPLLTSPAIKPSSTFQGMMNCSLSSKEANNLLLFSSMLDVFLWVESQWLSLLLVCLLNLCILIRGLGEGLFSLEEERCYFHFFPLVFLPLGKVPLWS